jgi:hypothetical protein
VSRCEGLSGPVRSVVTDADAPDGPNAGPFLARLEPAERAIRSGLGLATAEVTWILGVRPGSSPLTRGGIIATRTGWNCWKLSAASPESTDKRGKGCSEMYG